MAKYQNLHEQFADLNVDEEENEDFVFEDGVEEEVNKYALCLVGRFSTEKNINTRAMISKMADVWKPAMGVNIKEIDPGIFLFQFYHREDMLFVINGGPWSFDNAMLIISTVPPGADPLSVPLWHLEMWIQIHELPAGFMSEAVGRQLGDFFGEFLLYDAKNNSSIWMEYMRLKIRIDVRRPLKRKKKITRKNGTEFVVMCKYERLGDFCFVCGLVSHTERYCRKNIDNKGVEGPKDWGGWLRATPRRAANQNRSKWLRDENDAEWEAKLARDRNNPYFAGASYGDKDKGKSMAHDFRETGSNRIKNSVSLVEKSGIFQNEILQIKDRDYGLDREENDGLNLEDRKRRRSGPQSNCVMDTNENIIGPIIQNTELLTDADISTSDFSASSKQELATPAVQASQLQ